MKKHLLSLLVCAFILLSGISLHAQVKGDPSPNGTLSDQTAPQKTSSRLSSDLKKLYDNYGPRAKIAQSTQKPFLPGDGMNNYLQIKGNMVVVDVTVKGDLQTTRAELQKLGFQVKASFGRVISGLMPIN